MLFTTIYWNLNDDRIQFVSERTIESYFTSIAASAIDINNGCNIKQLKNEAKIELDEYVFESMAYKPLNDFVDKKLIVAEFSLFNNEDYRILNISQGFNYPLTINIYDKKHKLIQTNLNNPSIDTFDFKATSSGDYQIEFIPSPEDIKNVNKKCIAFSLGYK